MPSTILGTLLHSLDQADRSAPTLLGAGDFFLSSEDLAAELAGLAGDLRSFGISRRDRVAYVLPPGPEHAIIFLAVASSAVAAPLNPAYHEADFVFYLSDLNASALVLPAGLASPARAVALNTGVPILELHQTAPVTAGRRLRLSASTSLGRPVSDDGMAGSPEDVALVLHTSGTTSRPKQVPLTHANLLASARHIGTTLALGPADRCLNVMPLFHIHGLVAGLLAPLAAGGSVICTPAFQAEQLPAWLARWHPTWLTAVPTMHQAALAHYAATPALALLPRPLPSSLRLIRSSSAALPATVFAGLEALFGVPVVESYGMTEAAHQMASNPLPPRARKPGSVGLPAGPEITILTPDGHPLPIGETGEIAIRGPNVTTGYVNHPEANASAFTADGWFRTGDQGHLDTDGYLTLTGRLKELINRGGEKIAPREIDEALLAHPAVRQAVAFAVQHPTLGETIAAAVVLAPGSTLEEGDLIDHALSRLPFFKVPARILLLPDIPKGPTGKIQRIGLATRLAAELAPASEAPTSVVEARICAVFSEVLGLSAVGRRDNFFALGGDSLRATRALTRLRSDFGLDLPASLISQKPTAARLAASLEALLTEADDLAYDPELDDLARSLAKLSPEERASLLGPLDNPVS